MHNITLLECIIQSKKIENKRTVITTIWKNGLSLVRKITVPKIAKVITLVIPLACSRIVLYCIVYNLSQKKRP